MENKEMSTAVEESTEQVECRHHWVIESPAGPFSRGICRWCGQEREFKNYLENIRWEEFSLERASFTDRYPGVGKGLKDSMEPDEDA